MGGVGPSFGGRIGSLRVPSESAPTGGSNRARRAGIRAEAQASALRRRQPRRGAARNQSASAKRSVRTACVRYGVRQREYSNMVPPQYTVAWEGTRAPCNVP